MPRLEHPVENRDAVRQLVPEILGIEIGDGYTAKRQASPERRPLFPLDSTIPEVVFRLKTKNRRNIHRL